MNEYKEILFNPLIVDALGYTGLKYKISDQPEKADPYIKLLKKINKMKFKEGRRG